MSDILDNVQKNLINHLKNFIRLSDETISLLSPNNKTAGAIRAADLKQKIDDVKNLQIRMTILAPMKTGKSTILNAIIGDEILPIHDEAMTVLPTEIVLQYSNEQHSVNEPCLWLTDVCRDILKEIQERVYTALNRTSFSSLDKNLKSNSHLIVTAQKVREKNNATDWLTEKTTGSENINEVLRYINDLVHIFIFLYPCNVHDSDDQSPDRLLAKFSQNIPKVQILKTLSETCSHASASPTASRPYHLLLVDTPGPNEETASDRLKEIIEEEIKKADIVLVALDYTALGTEVDAKIAEAVRKVCDIKDPNYVYAVVNKVDQRQENGKSAEDVKKHIATKYEISEEKVFELKARYGLTACKFLAMYKSSSKNEELLVTKRSIAARAVLRQFYPINFESKMNNIEDNELKKLADELYSISGIPELLTTAITNINGEIIRRCIESAFRMGYKLCDELKRDIRLRRKHLHHTAEVLQLELDNLRHDQQTAHQIKENFDADTETKCVISRLYEELQSIFTKAKGMVLDDMNVFFSEKDKRWLDLTKWRSYLYTKRTHATVASMGGTLAGGILASIFTFTGIGIAIGGVVIIGVYFHSSGIIEFDKYEDAEKFIKIVIEKANNISAESYNMVTTQINNACNDALQNIQRACLRKINEIINNIRQRFDRNMEFPQCNIPVLEVRLQHIALNSIPISCRYRPFFGLVPFTLSCERDTQKHTRFQISRQKLHDECEKLVNVNMETIKNEIHQEVYRMMRKIVIDQVDVFYNFLHKYEEDINDNISNKQCNKEHVEEAKEQLNSLKTKLDTEKNKFDECCRTFKHNYMTTMAN